MRRIFFTGVLKSGKDYIARQAGLQIIGFADPLYQIAQVLLGVYVSSTAGKDIPGVRAFLQNVGQWGRGEINDRYPLTPERSFFREWLLAKVSEGVIDFPGVNWSEFGYNKDIWLDCLLARARTALEDPECPGVAATNVRYENEFKAMAADGWTHFHSLCSIETRNERLSVNGNPPSAAVLNDMSEQLAIGLDKQVLELIRRQPKGKQLRVIWNDHRPSPSMRLFSISQFLAQVQEERIQRAAEVPLDPEIQITES